MSGPDGIPPKYGEQSLDPLTEQKLAAWLAEYQALRTEIEWLIQDGTRYQNFAITLVGIVIAALGWILKDPADLLLPILLAIPFVFSHLGFLYLRQHEEVFVIAAYLREYLRPRVRSLLSDDSLWGWEEFKAKRTQELTSRTLVSFLSTNTVIVMLRTLLFLLPSLLALLAATLYSLQAGLDKLRLTYSDPSVVTLSVIFLFDVLLVVLFAIHVVRRGDFLKSILGLESQRPSRPA